MTDMKRFRLAIIGCGTLGKACARIAAEDAQLEVAGFVRRADRVAERRGAPFDRVPAAAHISELKQVDEAAICMPVSEVMQVAHDLLQRGVPIVECAVLHGGAFEKHAQEIGRFASHHGVAAVAGAGWDPGALSLFRGLFALLTPNGHTEMTHSPGIRLHHTTIAQAIPGIKRALSTELRTAQGKLQRYVYVEAENGADRKRIEEQIRNDPLFPGGETFVFPVESPGMLEEEGHGVVMQRHGTTAGTGQFLLLEARFSEPVLAAQMMIAAARALPVLEPGGHSIFDLPFGILWGGARRSTSRQWA